MKKYMVVCAGLSLALALASCTKSSESAYKKAYEKAKSQEAAQRVSEPTEVPATVVAPVTNRPANQRVVDNSDNVSVRQERVSLINGSGLKNFSVVVGSFGLQANAEGLPHFFGKHLPRFRHLILHLERAEHAQKTKGKYLFPR